MPKNTSQRQANATTSPTASLPWRRKTPRISPPHLGPHAWFQLYPPRDEGIRTDLLNRAKSAGFCTLVLTVDVPTASRRERQVRSGLTNPPKITPRILAQIATCPTWASEIAKRGMPHMRTLDAYTDTVDEGRSSIAHVGYLLRTSPDWDYVNWLRDNWDGPFIVKGVMRAEDAPRLEHMGVDTLWVSNHAGRQFDATPATYRGPACASAQATNLPIILDGGDRRRP